MVQPGLLSIVCAACAVPASVGTGSHSDTGDVGLVLRFNTGEACLAGPADAHGALTMAAGAPAVVEVTLDACVTGGAADRQASCDAYAVGSEIAVTATGSYRLDAEATMLLTCSPLVAVCDGPPLAAGTWALHYAGGHSDGFTLPGTFPRPCATAP